MCYLCVTLWAIICCDEITESWSISLRDLVAKYEALAEAEAILDAGSVGHNYLNFYEDAMEACLQIDAWDEVDRDTGAIFRSTERDFAAAARDVIQ